MFLAPQFFLGGPPPEFYEWDYKIQRHSDHVAKFQGDRSRELGEGVAKRKERKKEDTSRVNISPSGTTVPGGLTKINQYEFLLLNFFKADILPTRVRCLDDSNWMFWATNVKTFWHDKIESLCVYTRPAVTTTTTTVLPVFIPFYYIGFQYYSTLSTDPSDATIHTPPRISPTLLITRLYSLQR